MTIQSTPSRQVKSVCFFNNKGGVGKTTLVCNIASYLALELNKRVLLVDADPQCNSTQLLLETSTVESLYESESAKSKLVTLNEILAPILVGESSIAQMAIGDFQTETKFGLTLLPGHPRLALLEDKLSRSWGEFKGGDAGGARITNWTTQFLQGMAASYDYIFFDVGPSLGAINRSILIGADYIVVPMGCDIFSQLGVDNIGAWLSDWKQGYEDALKATLRSHKDLISSYPVRESVEKSSKVAGYTVQQYITKTIKGERRPTEAYDKIIKDIPQRLENKIGKYFAEGIDKQNMHLGDVPHMFSLVPLAQNAHVPIHRLTSADGLAGGQRSQLDQYRVFIKTMCQRLVDNLQLNK